MILPLLQLHTHLSLSSDNTVPALVHRFCIPKKTISNVYALQHEMYGERIYTDWGFSCESQLPVTCRVRYSSHAGLLEAALKQRVKIPMEVITKLLAEFEKEVIAYQLAEQTPVAEVLPDVLPAIVNDEDQDEDADDEDTEYEEDENEDEGDDDDDDDDNESEDSDSDSDSEEAVEFPF